MERSTGKNRRFSRTLGGLLTVVAIVAAILTVARPFMTPAVVRAANRVMTGTPDLRSGIDARHYRAESAIRTPSGFWEVRFVRVAGTGSAELSIGVPQEAVDRVRFRPW